MRPTKPYATVRPRPPEPPRSPYQPVVLVEGPSRWDVFENGLWLASFRERPDADEFRRKRLRLPWRTPS